MPNADIAPSLGRDLSGGASTATVNLLPPASVYADRINTIDLRVAKILRVGRSRTQVGVDIYNLTNTDTPLTYLGYYAAGGGNVQTPTGVLPARFAKLSLQVDF